MCGEKNKKLPNAFNCDKMMVFYYYRPVSPISNSGTSSVVWLWLCFFVSLINPTDSPTDRLADRPTAIRCFNTVHHFLDSAQHHGTVGKKTFRILPVNNPLRDSNQELFGLPFEFLHGLPRIYYRLHIV